MRVQATLEYLLFVSGITVVALAIAASLLPSAQHVGSATKVNLRTASFGDLIPPIVDLNVFPSSGTVSTIFDINCTAYDENLAYIELYLDGTLLKRCTTSPCIVKRPLPLGSHRVDCIAGDTNNLSRDFFFLRVS